MHDCSESHPSPGHFSLQGKSWPLLNFGELLSYFWPSATLLMPITTTNKNKLIYRMKNPSFLGWGFTEDYSCACTYSNNKCSNPCNSVMRVTCCSTAPMRQVLNPVGFPTIMVMFNERIRNYKGPVPAHGWRVRRRFRPLWPRLSRVSRCFRCLTASPGRAVGSWSWRVLDGRDIYAHPRREARPRVHLRYRSATAMTSDLCPQGKMAGGTGHPHGQRWIRRSRTTNCRPGDTTEY